MPGGESHGVRSPACVEKLRRQTVAHKEKHPKIRPGNDFPRAGFCVGAIYRLAESSGRGKGYDTPRAMDCLCTMPGEDCGV